MIQKKHYLTVTLFWSFQKENTFKAIVLFYQDKSEAELPAFG